MNPKDISPLEAKVGAHALEGFVLLADNIDSDPEVAFQVAAMLNEIRESFNNVDELDTAAKKRLNTLFNKIGVPLLERLKRKIDEMEGGSPAVDPRLN